MGSTAILRSNNLVPVKSAWGHQCRFERLLRISDSALIVVAAFDHRYDEPDLPIGAWYCSLYCGGHDPAGDGQMPTGIGRRQFISALGGPALAWPLTARAQQPILVIGLLNVAKPGGLVRPLTGFQRGLEDFGYVEGRNIAIEQRWAEADRDQNYSLKR
jgi:hypothetical protein